MPGPPSRTYLDVRLYRGNAFAELHGAPRSFTQALQKHLAVPLERVQRDDEGKVKTGTRFGRIIWNYDHATDTNQPWGSLVREDGRVPAGLAAHVLALAKHYGLPCEYFDARARPEERVPWWSVRASWRPYQDEVQKRIIQFSCGVLHMPPRAGKTLVAARAIDTFAVDSLYIAPSVQIVAQTYREFVKHFGEDSVARLDGSATAREKDITRPIVVATAASAVKQDAAWLKTRQMLVIDEFHHAAADSYHLISERCENAYYRLGLTGTYFRSGEDALAMEAICSQVIYEISVGELVEGSYIAQPRVVFVPTQTAKVKRDSWDEVYRDGLVACENRNAKIKFIAESLGNQQGIPTIVLVNRREHADALGEQIPSAFVVKGGEAMTSRTLEDFAKGRFNILIGTSVIGEGVDIPRAGALVYASGGDATVAMVQSYFRPLTKSEGKGIGLIYDFQDEHNPTLHRHSVARFEFAKKHIGNFCSWL